MNSSETTSSGKLSHVVQINVPRFPPNAILNLFIITHAANLPTAVFCSYLIEN